jgi:hypothetical protein
MPTGLHRRIGGTEQKRERTMGLIFELEESDFAGYIADGEIYAARVTNIRDVEKPYKDKDGNPVKKVEFKFQLVSDDPHDGTDMWGETSTKFVAHDECKLRNWARSILARDLPIGYRLDTDELLDRACRVIVGLKEYPDKATGEIKQRNFVRDVMPSREAMANMQYEEF